jgi:hypothetical protein
MTFSPPRTALQRVLAALATPGMLVALLAFFFPWYSVSCGDMTLATASGYDAATHGFHPPPSAEPTLAFGAGPGTHRISAPPPGHLGATQENEGDSRRDPWLLAMPVLVAAALFAIGRSFFVRDPRSSVGATSLLALAATIVPLAHAIVLRGRIRDAVAERAGVDPHQQALSEALQHSITFHLEGAWYLAVAGALVATVATGAWWFSLTTSPAAGSSAPQR